MPAPAVPCPAPPAPARRGTHLAADAHLGLELGELLLVHDGLFHLREQRGDGEAGLTAGSAAVSGRGVNPPALPPRPPCLRPASPLPTAGGQPPAQLPTAPLYLPGAGVALSERRDRSGRGAGSGTARGRERDGGRKGGTPRRAAHAPLPHPSAPAGGALTRGGAGRVSGRAGSIPSAHRAGPRPGDCGRSTGSERGAGRALHEQLIDLL